MTPSDSAVPQHEVRADGAIFEELPLALLDQSPSKTIIRHRGWLVRRMLLLADMAGLLAAFAIADTFDGDKLVGPPQLDLEVLGVAAALISWAIVAKFAGLYDHDEERADHSTVDDLARVIQILTIGVWTVQVIALVAGLGTPNLTRLVAFWASGVALIVVGRIAARALCRRSAMYTQNTVIVGAGDVGQLVARKMLQHPEYGINLLGFVDERAAGAAAGPRAHLTVLGTPSRPPGLVAQLDVERVIVAFCRTRPPSDGRADPLAERPRRPGRHRPALLRRRRPASATIHTVEGLPLSACRRSGCRAPRS